MASPSQLLVPMDGSPLSKRALEIALDEYPDADVTVLHVIDPTEPGYSYPVDVDPLSEPLHGSEAWFERAEELAAELFEAVEATAADHDREVSTVSVAGEAGREIIEYAESHDVDQIILGSHGRDDPGRFLLGSVTEIVVFRSPVRVLLVR